MKKNISFEKKITFPTMIGEISAIDLEHDLKFIDESNVEGSFIVKGKYKLTEASRLEEDFNYKIPTEIVLTEKLDLQTTHIDIKDFYYEIENDDTMVCYIEIQLEGLEKLELEEELVRNKEEDERECDGDVKTDEEKEIPHKEVKDNVAKEKEESITDNKSEDSTTNDTTIEENISNERNELEDEVLNEETIKTEKTATQQSTKKEESVTMEEDNYINNTYENTEENEQVESLSNIFSSLSEKEETFATYSVYILREDESVNSIIEKYKTTKEELEKYNDLNTLTKGSKIIIPYLNND